MWHYWEKNLQSEKLGLALISLQNLLGALYEGSSTGFLLRETFLSGSAEFWRGGTLDLSFWGPASFPPNYSKALGAIWTLQAQSRHNWEWVPGPEAQEVRIVEGVTALKFSLRGIQRFSLETDLLFEMTKKVLRSSHNRSPFSPLPLYPSATETGVTSVKRELKKIGTGSLLALLLTLLS